MTEPMTLAGIPGKYAQPDPSTLSKLPKPTSKDNQKGRCDECGGWHGLPAVHLDYQGHAEITLALIEIDPDWKWEPFALDEQGLPAVFVRNGTLVLWGRLTVLGKTLPGVGTCPVSKDEAEKELIGDFLRNASIRFGIATKLWSKAEHEDDDTTRQTRTRTAPRAPRETKPAQAEQIPGAATQAQINLLAIECKKAGIEEDHRIGFVATLVGRPIKSTKDLTREEASAAINQLKGVA